MKLTKSKQATLKKARAARARLNNWVLVELTYKINEIERAVMTKVSLDPDTSEILKVWEPNRVQLEKKFEEHIFTLEYPTTQNVADAVKRELKRVQKATCSLCGRKRKLDGQGFCNACLRLSLSHGDENT